ncbi:condensation domain-containing protein [Caldalkalibacillus mannanilyticus]|uniref:condensation domain-containing protein n=1 Tax=Caldalkalibacillus mannanilyticus TaxID=1418 RepID=UPI00046A1FF3|nr:condensation domain-containing protein [Caldalkalibacillus mannanilyticus]
MEYIYENQLDISSLELLIIGSDYCPVEEFQKLISRFGTNMRIINSYGVTEACVDSCYFEQALIGSMNNLPIGKPLPGVTMYVLDENRLLQPIGLTGELYIGGAGVGRGYLNLAELTSEKFVDNPYKAGEKMYRTGDLARWLPDGNLDYLGRMDHQVKIRGFRIEIGEIESHLLQCPSVEEAVVVAREDDRGQKVLCAYFVAEKELTVSELRAQLSEELPGYMIPSYFRQLEKMPLTPNGKVDRKALPAPEGSMLTGVEYVSPRTEVEKTMATVWQSVLGVERVGLIDHFFELGGDSIKSIQVASRLYQAGYKLEMRDLFKYPTLGSLSQRVQPIARKVDQREITGEVQMTPIQKWFFEQSFADPHHYNQSMMLYRKKGFDYSALRKVLDKIVEHHDALRMVFRQTEPGYIAWNRGIKEGELYHLEVLNIKEETNCAQVIEEHANKVQSSIDLEHGPLVKASVFQCADGDHLLIVIHHTVIDGVSWRILLEDIAVGYEQVLNNEEVSLPAKTDAYQTWSEQLLGYANSSQIEKEKAHWQTIAEAEVTPLTKDGDVPCSIEEDSESYLVTWSKESTEQLLKQVHQAYNTDMNDILLTALALAVQKWRGVQRILVNLEGHGRESIIPEIDITRTVGWFTSEFPILLEIEEEKGRSYQIKNIKESLRHIPNKGIGYGIWRYLSDGHTTNREVKPEISFNYLVNLTRIYKITIWDFHLTLVEMIVAESKLVITS